MKSNPENFEAFDRLISNYLMTHQEKLDFVRELTFEDDNQWLSDYYRSRVSEDIVPDLTGKVAISPTDPIIFSPEGRRDLSVLSPNPRSFRSPPMNSPHSP